MKHNVRDLLFMGLCVFSWQVCAAVNIVECEDKKGERSFHKNCPPGMTEVGSKKLNIGGAGGQKGDGLASLKVTLYAIPDCELCEEVREFLQAKDISFEEKNANENIEIQKELTDLAGALRVPTTIIDGEVVTGYKRSQMESIIEKARSSSEADGN